MLRTIDINMAGRIWEFTPIENKMEHTGCKRIIYFGPRAQEILRPWLRTELESFLFSPREVMASRWADQRAKRKSPVQPSQVCRKKTRPQRKSFTAKYFRTHLIDAQDGRDGSPSRPFSEW